jgi:hypothetical protein
LGFISHLETYKLWVMLMISNTELMNSFPLGNHDLFIISNCFWFSSKIYFKILQCYFTLNRICWLFGSKARINLWMKFWLGFKIFQMLMILSLLPRLWRNLFIHLDIHMILIDFFRFFVFVLNDNFEVHLKNGVTNIWDGRVLTKIIPSCIKVMIEVTVTTGKKFQSVFAHLGKVVPKSSAKEESLIERISFLFEFCLNDLNFYFNTSVFFLQLILLKKFIKQLNCFCLELILVAIFPFIWTFYYLPEDLFLQLTFAWSNY